MLGRPLSDYFFFLPDQKHAARFPVSSVTRHIDLVAARCKSPCSKHATEQWISSCKVQDKYNQSAVLLLYTESAVLQHSYLAQHLTSKYFEVHKQTTLRNLKSRDVPTASHLTTDGSEFVTHAAEPLYVSRRCCRGWKQGSEFHNGQ